MKQNLRKVLAVSVLTASVLGLTACGNTAAAEPEVTYDEAYLHSVADFLIQNWAGMPMEDIANYAVMDAEDAETMIGSYGLPFTADAFTTAFAGYEGSAEELGAYVSTDSYDTPIVKGDEITLNVNLTYEQRPAQLSIVFNKKSVAESVALNPEYTMGEILEKAGMNTILGMGTVFAVLIFISLVIYCFNFIPNIQAMFSKKKKEEAPAAAPAKAAPAAPAAAPAAEELADDGELVAAITAAICAYSGTSSDGFVVRSIRRADSATWKRA
ncbi:MAG: OadG family protein [Clostridiales bacterium]|nr:OadG family protein [Clostridiales bacterium]